jgi:outer membrane receptor for Fe3+-dicitrate
MMSVMSINYMLNMAYDFHTHNQIAAVVNAACDTRSSPRGGLKTTKYQEKGWNPRTEDSDRDEAPFLGDTKYPAKA